MKLNLSLLVTLLIADTVSSQCRTANWWKSFDRKGWSKCGATTEYVTGFYRNNKRSDDPIFLLEEAKCCKAPAPNQNRASTCKNANWWSVLDRLVTLTFIVKSVDLILNEGRFSHVELKTTACFDYYGWKKSKHISRHISAMLMFYL